MCGPNLLNERAYQGKGLVASTIGIAKPKFMRMLGEELGVKRPGLEGVPVSMRTGPSWSVLVVSSSLACFSNLCDGQLGGECIGGASKSAVAEKVNVSALHTMAEVRAQRCHGRV